jgi:hypothetical protein
VRDASTGDHAQRHAQPNPDGYGDAHPDRHADADRDGDVCPYRCGDTVADADGNAHRDA